MLSHRKRGIFLALLAAALYALSTPFSKILMAWIPPALMAGFLYLGAGLAMALLLCLQFLAGARHPARRRTEKHLTQSDLPYVMAMILLDIAAPILMMFGLLSTRAANASLLNNFEIVATTGIAWLFFKEKISRRLAWGIALIFLSCCLLCLEGADSFAFSSGSILIVAAACCWGLENNCTRSISDKDPMEIVLLKGLFSGAGSILTGLLLHEHLTCPAAVVPALLLGMAAYGLSIYFYIYAQRLIGAARTSAYYAAAPFIGAFLSLLLFHVIPGWPFFAALLLMAFGSWLAA